MAFDLVQPTGKEWLQVQCLELRREGKTFTEIASQLQLSERIARRYVGEALDGIISPLVAELRALELARLEEVHRLVWAEMRTESGVNLRAVDRLLNISKARRELMGLDR